MSITTTVAQPWIVGGVDAHKDTHHAVVLDGHGIRLADRAFPATLVGYQQLLNWLRSVGSIDRVGVESTGSYGAGLARFLESQQIRVLEVNMPHAHIRAKKGKDDLIDAEATARKVLSGEASALPKVTTGVIESIRLLRIARESAVKARSVALVQLQDVLITAPVALRESINAKGGRGKSSQCAKLRPDTTRLSEPAQAAKMTLRSLAKRIETLEEEIAVLDGQLDPLVMALM